jgi:hypothetical protein
VAGAGQNQPAQCRTDQPEHHDRGASGHSVAGAETAIGDHQIHRAVDRADQPGTSATMTPFLPPSPMRRTSARRPMTTPTSAASRRVGGNAGKSLAGLDEHQVRR